MVVLTAAAFTITLARNTSLKAFTVFLEAPRPLTGAALSVPELTRGIVGLGERGQVMV